MTFHEARIIELRTRAEALVVRAAGMQALNQFRMGLGQGVAYDDGHFEEIAQQIEGLANEMRKYQEGL